MISILPVQTKNFRAFGWVQDPSNLRSLCDVVAVFDENTAKHQELVSDIAKLVEERDGRDELITALNVRPLKLSYPNLVGTSFTPRSESRCNGIIQAAVKGQGRAFIGDWPADNFVRWAYAFGFIGYNYIDDTFSITQSGKELTYARGDGCELSDEEKEILITAALAYPPAVRILNLLAEGEEVHLTKFEIGKQLGFVGENGFTSQPQSIFIKTLAVTVSAKEKNSMKTDWEGSSDKYARMIAGWLCKLGLVEQIPKDITVTIAKKQYTESIGQSYMITAEGIRSLNRTVGKSRYKRIPKNICFEMLATKGSDREYLRTRRAFIIKFLAESKGYVALEGVSAYLSAKNINDDSGTIKDDIRGLINIGLNIVIKNDSYKWNDEINGFVIPLTTELAKSELSDTKDNIRAKMKYLPHEYLSLVDLAYDSKQNRLFEMKTLELLTEECKYNGLHLGGSRKPDGIIYTSEHNDNYGVIIDTKAYSKGYSLPISQADEMERYIRENRARNKDPNQKDSNPNEWWLSFGENVNKFYFMFVSGHFSGNFAAQIKRISRNTNTDGAAAAVADLILIADSIKGGETSHKDVEGILAQSSHN